MAIPKLLEIERTYKELEESNSSGGVFDVVIRTQEEFETLIASSTWLGAKSVCFVGDGGTLKFTRNDGYGITIPNTVFNINGVNNAIINVVDVVGTDDNFNLYAFGYDMVDDSMFDMRLLDGIVPYHIDGISIVCNSVSGHINGFFTCANMTNCNCTVVSAGYACCYDKCMSVCRCNAMVQASNNKQADAFYECVTITDCFAVATSNGESYGMRYCSFVDNCIAVAVSSNSVGYGVYGCDMILNCYVCGQGTTGYGLFACARVNNVCAHYLSNNTTNTTALTGGTMTFVDTNTVG